MTEDDREKYPSEEAERFQVRMPPGLRDRIKIAAEKSNRSMNAEIVRTLEEAYPEPITLDEIVADISQTVEYLKRFKGSSMLMVLADSLDNLLMDIGRSQEGTAEDRRAVTEHAYTHGKRRFIPPED